jgi:hypothetical protein
VSASGGGLVLVKRNFREEDGGYVTSARGVEVLETPPLNKGTAFTPTDPGSADLPAGPAGQRL